MPATTEYDHQAVCSILPTERFGSYLVAMAGDQERALALYAWNTAVSAALWEIIGHAEVTIRHAIDTAMQGRHKYLKRGGDWMDDDARELNDRSWQDLEDARESAAQNRVRDGQPVTRGHVVAELSFGFWRFMLAKENEDVFGGAITRRFKFAPRRISAKDMEDLRTIVLPLYKLRNRIAHNEPVWHTPLANRHHDALRIIGYVDPDLRLWVEANSRFDSVMSVRPN
ncbi:Abi family protein [Pseudarthrobacter sp. H3Y2-7]|uniref:Abi family protein n=1 Tax=Pseudarthrobacter naphthalenicus TaxID=3031328 RepID=UPI0023AF21DD|nr:Abi family protein [Pseudarthrobacter sp. H3Y2-7]MDE8670893.1 Abi family protein [Pseudarthrobacter sp. H3Y2-7]